MDNQKAVLQAFSRALEREAHVLTRHPELLWQQMYNRLQWEDEPIRQILLPELEQRSMPGAAPWLKLRTRLQESKALIRTQEGHTSDGIALCFSPDGEILASSSDDNTTRLWDVKSGAGRAILKWHVRVRRLTFSPDGKILLTISDENSCKLWNTHSGSPIETKPGRLLALAQDWNAIATEGSAKNVRVWNPCTGEEISLLQEPNYLSKMWIFSPDGTALLSYEKKPGSIQLWDVQNGNLRATIQAHPYTGFTEALRICCFSPDGRKFISAGSDSTMRLWDTATAKQLALLKGHKQGINTCAFSPDGKTLASGSDDMTVRLWNLDSGKQIRVLEGHTARVISCSISPDGQVIISTDSSHPQGRGDVVTKLWEFSSGRLLASHNARGAKFFENIISPDGQLLAKISGSFRLYRLHNGEELPRLEGHTEEVLAFAFSPDGNTIASTGRDKTVLLWDLRYTGQAAILQGHRSKVTSCVFSEAGTTLVTSGGRDNTVKLWDVHEGREKATLHHESMVNSVAIAPDDRTLASANQDRTVRIWDIQTGTELGVLEGHAGGVYDCAFSPDGQSLASVGDELLVRIWDIQNRSQKSVLQGHNGVITSCAFFPDGKTLATGSVDQTARLWNMNKPEQEPRVLKFKGSLEYITISPDGDHLVAITGSKNFQLVSGKSGKPTMEYVGHTGHVTSCAFNPNGSLILTTSKDKTLKLWLTETGENINSFQCIGESTCCDFRPDGRLIAAGDIGGNVYVLELMGFQEDALALRSQFHKKVDLGEKETGIDLSAWKKRVSIRQGHEGKIKGCAISKDGRWIVTASADNTLKVWGLNHGDDLGTLRGHTRPVYCCAVSSDGKYIASGSSDNTLRIWDAARQLQAAVLQGHRAEIQDCAFSPNGNWLVSASGDMTMKIWDAETWKEKASLSGHDNSVYACAVSPDEQWIVSASADHTLKIWDAAKKRSRAILKGHTDSIKSCAISPDGQWVVSASEDKTLQVWDANMGNHMATLKGHTQYGTRCAVSPDGCWIISTNGDRTMRVWDTTNWQEKARLVMPGLVISMALHPSKPFAFCAIHENNLHLIELEGIEYGSLIVTAMESDAGLLVTCPACQKSIPIAKKMLGIEITCSNGQCSQRLKINPFTLQSTIRKKPWMFWK